MKISLPKKLWNSKKPDKFYTELLASPNVSATETLPLPPPPPPTKTTSEVVVREPISWRSWGGWIMASFAWSLFIAYILFEVIH